MRRCGVLGAQLRAVSLGCFEKCARFLRGEELVVHRASVSCARRMAQAPPPSTSFVMLLRGSLATELAKTPEILTLTLPHVCNALRSSRYELQKEGQLF